jgi:hypothetical protein
MIATFIAWVRRALVKRVSPYEDLSDVIKHIQPTKTAFSERAADHKSNPWSWS